MSFLPNNFYNNIHPVTAVAVYRGDNEGLSVGQHRVHHRVALNFTEMYTKMERNGIVY